LALTTFSVLPSFSQASTGDAPTRVGSVTVRSVSNPFQQAGQVARQAAILNSVGLPQRDQGVAIPFRSQNFRASVKTLQQPSNIIDNSTAPRVLSHPLNSDNLQLQTSFDGLNAWDQRYANGGNQFQFEPPDQGLCVGNGYILESVNTVLHVYDTKGKALGSAIDLHTFYGYPAEYDRNTGLLGPYLTDPSCLFDQETQRWFQVITGADQDPVSGKSLPKTHIDIAVSQTSDPTGAWVTYSLPTQNNGTEGTPNHCKESCLGDYPHIGTDHNGFYVTTNEYDMESNAFLSAQIYAFSKKALSENQPVVDVTQFDTAGMVKTSHGVEAGSTVWPAQSPRGQTSSQQGGSAYFLSSVDPVDERTYGHEIVVWALSNTRSLNDLNPNLKLSNKVMDSEPFGIPPLAKQKMGSLPLAECLNDRQQLLGSGKDCWTLFLDEPPKEPAVIGPLDTNDTRMQQVAYVNGLLYGALGTVVNVEHEERAGIAYFLIKPRMNSKGVVTGKIKRQGYLASQGLNITFPSFGALRNGKGAIGFTVVGESLYPSAGYALFDGRDFGDIHLAAMGKGPQDGFTEYPAMTGGEFRPRWGDYGAVATDGKSVWIASEYTAQTCTLNDYLQEPLGTCGGTRASASNWGTRISEILP
jgi:hypothetical protein